MQHHLPSFHEIIDRAVDAHSRSAPATNLASKQRQSKRTSTSKPPPSPQKAPLASTGPGELASGSGKAATESPGHSEAPDRDLEEALQPSGTPTPPARYRNMIPLADVSSHEWRAVSTPPPPPPRPGQERRPAEANGGQGQSLEASLEISMQPQHISAPEEQLTYVAWGQF